MLAAAMVFAAFWLIHHRFCGGTGAGLGTDEPAGVNLPK